MIVVLFGPRGSGVTLIAGLVSGASKHATSIATPETVQQLGLRPHCKATFVETHTVEDVESLITEGIATAATNAVFVKVLPDGLAIEDAEWPAREAAIEELLRAHSVAYHTIMNKYKDPMAACIGLARAANLKS